MTTTEQMETEKRDNGDEALSPEERIAECTRRIQEALTETNCQINVVPSPNIAILVESKQINQTFQVNITSR